MLQASFCLPDDNVLFAMRSFVVSQTALICRHSRAVPRGATETSISQIVRTESEILRARVSAGWRSQFSKLPLLIVAPKYSFVVNHWTSLIDVSFSLFLPFSPSECVRERKRLKKSDRKRKRRRMKKDEEGSESSRGEGDMWRIFKRKRAPDHLY